MAEMSNDPRGNRVRQQDGPSLDVGGMSGTGGNPPPPGDFDLSKETLSEAPDSQLRVIAEQERAKLGQESAMDRVTGVHGGRSPSEASTEHAPDPSPVQAPSQTPGGGGTGYGS